uniref:Uncharacterized protein n=1 Tax=Anguilla anguilla TaxID=7936 RepID=A0A0E9QK53_ANGAN
MSLNFKGSPHRPIERRYQKKTVALILEKKYRLSSLS